MNLRDRSEERIKLSGERLRTFRETLRLSQKEVADAMKVTQTRVHYIEKGKQDLNAEDLFLLAKEFGLNPAYILGIDANMINLQYKGSGKPVILDDKDKLKVMEEIFKKQGIQLPYING